MMWYELASRPTYTLWQMAEATGVGVAATIIASVVFAALGRAEGRRRRKADEDEIRECLNEQAEAAHTLRRGG